MEKIHIITDSTSDIPRALCEQYGIEVVPISLQIGQRSLQEYYDITPQEYWKVLEEEPAIPTTAQPTPTVYLEVYRAAKAQGFTHLLGILMNSKGSGSYQSACIARDMFYDECGKDMEILLLDSETYTYIYGRVVVCAAQMRADGENFEAIAAVAKSRLKRCEAILGVYSLKHLKKSGRISGGAAFVGEALGLRPISIIAAGGVQVIDKVRGDRNLPKGVIAKVKEKAMTPATQTAELLYADVPETALDEIEALLRSECGFSTVERYPIGPAVATNTGPKAFAVAYYGVPREA